MDSGSSFLSDYPALIRIVDLLNSRLEDRHPSIFGAAATHPILPIKRSKVVHDNLWGTVRFTWRELALIDSPVMQRLREIHQTGLAYHVYPSARHSRFEHSLGVTSIASRIYDALLHRQRGEIRDIAKAIEPDVDPNENILRFKQELRLAALLHDTGHSLFSHTSECVYAHLEPLVKASKELTKFVGKEKGAGEVLSFCLALTPALGGLLKRAERNLIGDQAFDDYNGPIDMENVALIIVGRSAHPFLQFLGDIVSSGFDADKLDYLLRDAKAAGLPLNYDTDRYLYDVRIQDEILADGNGNLKNLFSRIRHGAPHLLQKNEKSKFPHYDTYRLRLSKRAVNVIEQIIICKMMLFSYIYHHGKVRASEGLLERLLRRKVEAWRIQGKTDSEIICYFMEMTDASLSHMAATETTDKITKNCAYRLVNRLLPREVYRISGSSATHAAGDMIKVFLRDFYDREARTKTIAKLEQAIGEELIKAETTLGTDVANVLAQTGVWVDAPKPPKFEDVDAMLGNPMNMEVGVSLAQVFPIHKWTEAYEHYNYQIRIFSYSEHWELTKNAAKAAMKRVLDISGDDFYKSIQRNRN